MFVRVSRLNRLKFEDDFKQLIHTLEDIQLREVLWSFRQPGQTYAGLSNTPTWVHAIGECSWLKTFVEEIVVLYTVTWYFLKTFIQRT